MVYVKKSRSSEQPERGKYLQPVQAHSLWHYGAACLRSAGIRFGVDVSVEYAAVIAEHERNGYCNPAGLVKAAEYYGLEAELVTGSSRSDLIDALVARYVPIVPLFAWGYTSYFAVAHVAQTLCMMTPRSPVMTLRSISVFERSWFWFDRGGENFTWHPTIIVKGARSARVALTVPDSSGSGAPHTCAASVTAEGPCESATLLETTQPVDPKTQDDLPNAQIVLAPRSDGAGEPVDVAFRLTCVDRVEPTRVEPANDLDAGPG